MTGGLLIHPDGEHPIELPADVPEEILRQAPVSVKNRLSMTLGLAVKDKSEHRISSVYFPRALGELLKSPGASQLLLTPQANASSKGTPLSAVITSPSYMLEAQADYFGNGENTPTFGKGQSQKQRGLISSPVLPAGARGSVRASIIEPGTRTRSSSIPNPAFTSHPAVMAMATPPTELPAPLSPHETLHTSDSGQPSAPSSIGEPGPAMGETDTLRSASVSEPKVLVEDSDIKVSLTPASAEEETFSAAEAKRAELTQTIVPNQIDEQDHGPQEVVSHKQEESSRVLEQIPEVPTNAPPPPSETVATQQASAQEEEVDIIIHISESDAPKEQFFAELEATVPMPKQSNKDFGPVELEAPDLTFRLPPRQLASSSNPDKEVPRASIRQLDDFFKLPPQPMASSSSLGKESVRASTGQLDDSFKLPPRPVASSNNEDKGVTRASTGQLNDSFKLPPRPAESSGSGDKAIPRGSTGQAVDFFKLPTEQSIKPGMKPKDFGDRRTQEPIRPLKLKLTKKDGKMVPVATSSPASLKARESPGPSKLRMDVVADIIETMSNTPPGSPVHETNRSSSASSNSAQRWSHRSTRSLGPPEQAPAPPGPGGRSMVNPDFAAAGQFEGERKQKRASKKKSSGFVNINKEKWKNLFLNNGSSTNASSSSGASTANKSDKTNNSTTRPSSEAVPAAEMMTGSGKDVLWFKGDSKKSLGVSSA